MKPGESNKTKTPLFSWPCSAVFRSQSARSDYFVKVMTKITASQVQQESKASDNT